MNTLAFCPTVTDHPAPEGDKKFIDLDFQPVNTEFWLGDGDAGYGQVRVFEDGTISLLQYQGANKTDFFTFNEEDWKDMQHFAKNIDAEKKVALIG